MDVMRWDLEFVWAKPQDEKQKQKMKERVEGIEMTTDNPIAHLPPLTQTHISSEKKSEPLMSSYSFACFNDNFMEMPGCEI